MNRRRHSGWATKFGRWVADFGSERLARRLGYTRQGVYHWVKGHHSIPPPAARQIVKMSRGALSMDELYGGPNDDGATS